MTDRPGPERAEWLVPGATLCVMARKPEPARRPPPDDALPVPAPLEPPAWLDEEAGAIGVEFEPGEAQRLGAYLALLLQANTTMNLTSVTEPDAAWRRHILDSLTLVGALIDLPEGSSVVDVGSGGGLPGLPLAICMPGLKFTLLEATGKKAEFLRRAVAALDLRHVEVVQERAERFGHDRGVRTGAGRVGIRREAFDAVTARAVAKLASLVELTVPLAKVGGRVLLIKGEKATAELEEATPALHLLKAVHAQTIETPSGKIVVIEKRAATPRDYPRRDGEPTRSPLGVKA